MRHMESKSVTAKPASLPNYTEEQLTLIRNTIAKGATPEEFQLFMYRCKHLGLDPLKPGQIYFVKYGNNPGTIVIGIDGFRSMASRTGKHAGTKRGLLVDEKTNKCSGAWAEVYRSDWEQPARDEVDMSEYNTGKAMWAKMPRTMIKKVAEVSALRMAFPDDLGGIYSDDEIEVRDVTSEKPVKRVEDSLSPAPIAENAALTQKRKDLRKAQIEHGWSDGQLKAQMEFGCGRVSSKDLSLEDIDELIEVMKAKAPPGTDHTGFEENIDGTKD